MKTSSKVWLGIFTFLPLLFIIIFISIFFTIFFEQMVMMDDHYSNEFPFEFFQSISVFIIFIILTALMSLGVKIYYIVHTNNNPENDTAKKVLWTILLILGGTIASIVYFFIEITPLPSNKS